MSETNSESAWGAHLQVNDLQESINFDEPEHCIMCVFNVSSVLVFVRFLSLGEHCIL